MADSGPEMEMACKPSKRILHTAAHTLYRTLRTRQSLKVDPQGPAIRNLLHRYLLLPRTDPAHGSKTENCHEIGRQGTDFDENL